MTRKRARFIYGIYSPNLRWSYLKGSLGRVSRVISLDERLKKQIGWIEAGLNSSTVKRHNQLKVRRSGLDLYIQKKSIEDQEKSLKILKRILKKPTKRNTK